MLYSEIKDMLYSEHKDIINQLFLSFSFTENIIVDQLSMYSGRDLEEAKDLASKFGCIISDTDDQNVIVPANLQFNIFSCNDRETELIISRNGVTYYLNYIDPYEIFSVEFTEFGKKLDTYATAGCMSLYEAYEQLLKTEKIFGVKIIKDYI